MILMKIYLLQGILPENTVFPVQWRNLTLLPITNLLVNDVFEFQMHARGKSSSLYGCTIKAQRERNHVLLCSKCPILNTVGACGVLAEIS